MHTPTIHNPSKETAASAFPILKIATGIVVLGVGMFAICHTTSAATLPTVHLTQVQENNDSIRVYYQPVPGAADYRIYSLDDPTEVKYAGILHLMAPYGQHWVMQGTIPYFPYRSEADTAQVSSPKRLDVPALDIEMNGVDPAKQVKIVVEAVDTIGPAPYSNLATSDNAPVHKHVGMSMPVSMKKTENDSAADMELLGSNAGPTDDGRYSINGQGEVHTIPHAIARSRVIVAQPTGKPTLPSSPQASQVMFDTFAQGDIEEVPGTRNYSTGNVSYVMHSNETWQVDFQSDDIDDSRPFIMNRHYMDVLFDGSTPGHGPLHVAHGESTLSPVKTADFTNGRVLHLTMEVDGHISGRRWLGFALYPKSDPLQSLYPFTAKINNSQTAFILQINPEELTSDIWIDGKDQEMAGGPGSMNPFAQAPRPSNLGEYGMGLDNRSRFDLFISASRYVFLEDGRVLADQKFPHALPVELQHAKLYYVHYLYHTDNELNDIRAYAPYETVWLNLFPFSDERHWDNMGFEVLPASFDKASDIALSRLIRNSPSLKIVQAVKLP